MRMPASEIKRLSGAKTRAAGETILYARLQDRRWRYADREYTLAGFDSQKGLVHFTCTRPAEGGGVWHSRLGLPLDEAIVNESGDLSSAEVLL